MGVSCTVVVLTCFFNVWVCVCVGVLLFVGVLIMCVVVFTVFCIVCTLLFISFRLCIFILFFCTSVRTTATE